MQIESIHLKSKAMKYLIYLSLFLSAICAQSQNNYSSVRGTITDADNGDPLPFASVVLLDSLSAQVAAGSTDFDGKYILKQIKPGNYSLEISYVGYTSLKITKIKVQSNKIAIKDIQLQPGTAIGEIVVVAYKVPLVEIDKSSTGTKVYSEEIKSMAVRSAANVAKTVDGTYSRDYGGSGLNIRGSRSDRSHTYIDGVKVIGSTSLPPSNESYNQIVENSYHRVSLTPLSTFSIDVDKAAYSNVRRYINEGMLPPADAVRIEEMINYFSYNYPQPEKDEPFSITTEYADCPWNAKRKLVRIGIKGKEVALEEAPDNNLVFLIDVSGSMSSPDKLGLLKSGLLMLINQLDENDKVSIVVYAGAAGLVLPATKGNKKEQLIDAINKLSAGGSTAGGEGIQLAYEVAKDNFIKNGNNRIILATDGDFNVGISNQGELIQLIEEKRNDNIFLSVLGFGTGNLQDSKMEQIADKGNGNYHYIDNLLEAKKVLVTELGGTLLTIAKDVKLQIEFNPKTVKSYRLIGYENRLLNAEDFNDDKKDAGELGSGHTVTALYEIIPTNSKEELVSIDPLKYQNTNNDSTGMNEILTVKFRYKDPKEDVSKLITKVLYQENLSFSQASVDFRFSTSVAAFGYLLRDSKFKGDLQLKEVIDIAKESKGEDDEGYRAEFIRLMEMAELIK